MRAGLSPFVKLIYFISKIMTPQNIKFTFFMLVIFLLTFYYEIMVNFFKSFGFIVFLLLFVIIPVFFKFNYPLQRSLIFLSFVQRASGEELKNVNKTGISNIRNFFITTHENIRLGVWHILPNITDIKLPETEELRDKYYEQLLANGRPIIIYMHGNSGTRSSEHRVQLYKVLLNLKYHIITFDYRNYGDSTRHNPSEEGLVSDGISVYKWVHSKAQGSPIFIWGHSLGTGVSSHAMDTLNAEGFSDIKGLILESPFNNMRDEIREHPFTLPFRYLPFFDYFFLDPVNSNGILFESDRHLSKFSSPVLILHAKDDFIVPFILGRRLYEIAKRLRPKSAAEIEFVEFEAKLNYGHKCIYKSPVLENIVSSFIEKYI